MKCNMNESSYVTNLDMRENIFHCGLYCRAVSVTDNLCTKRENSSIFGSKIRGFKSRAGYNGTRTIHSVGCASLCSKCGHANT